MSEGVEPVIVIVVTTTAIGVAAIWILFAIKRLNSLGPPMRQALRSIVAITTVISLVLFVLSLDSEMALHLSFWFGFPSATCLAYLITFNKNVVLQEWTDIITLIRNWSSKGDIQAFYPRKGRNGKFEFGFTNDLDSNFIGHQKSQKIFDPIPFDKGAYFFRDGALFGGTDEFLYRPALASTVQRMAGVIGARITGQSVLKELEENTLAQLLLLHIFSDDSYSESSSEDKRFIRWGKNSASWLSVKNQITSVHIESDDGQLGKEAGGQPMFSYKIEHDWSPKQLAVAARMLCNNLPTWNKQSGIKMQQSPADFNLKYWIETCLLEERGLEYSKIIHYLIILSRWVSGEPINRYRWEGMVDGYCDGCRLSSKDITTDNKIEIGTTIFGAEDFMKAQQRVDNALRKPIEEFIGQHDAIMDWFLLDEEFDENEIQYIDSVIEAMMARLHRTQYLERQVRRGRMSPEDLVEFRKGIVAGITVSICLVVDSMKDLR